MLFSFDVWRFYPYSTDPFSFYYWMKIYKAPIFIPSFLCWEDRIYPCFFLSVPYFGHLPGPFFQVCGSKGGAVPLVEELLFSCLEFLVDKGGDVERNPPYSSCDGVHTKIRPSISFSGMYRKLFILRMNRTNSWYRAHIFFPVCSFCLYVGLKTNLITIQ